MGKRVENIGKHARRLVTPSAYEPHSAGSAHNLPAFGDSSLDCNVKDVHHGLRALNDDSDV